MPVHKCPDGKYRIGNGDCVFASKEKADAAYKAYLAKKNDSKNEELTLAVRLEIARAKVSAEIDRLYELQDVIYSMKKVIDFVK